MLNKNKEKQKRKKRDTWVDYFPRVTKDNTKYSRKKNTKERKKNKWKKFMQLWCEYITNGI